MKNKDEALDFLNQKVEHLEQLTEMGKKMIPWIVDKLKSLKAEDVTDDKLCDLKEMLSLDFIIEQTKDMQHSDVVKFVTKSYKFFELTSNATVDCFIAGLPITEVEQSLNSGLRFAKGFQTIVNSSLKSETKEPQPPKQPQATGSESHLN